MAVDHGALQVEVPLDRIEAAAVAVQRGRDTGGRLERIGEGRERVGLAAVGRDASIRKEVIGGEGLEQLDDSLEERDCLGTLWASRWQAGGLEGAVARSVGAPLVLARAGEDLIFLGRSANGAHLPELFILAVDVDPELLHEG